MFTASLWARYTGTRTQVALIFSGVLGSLGLLADRKETAEPVRQAGGQGEPS